MHPLENSSESKHSGDNKHVDARGGHNNVDVKKQAKVRTAL